MRRSATARSRSGHHVGRRVLVDERDELVDVSASHLPQLQDPGSTPRAVREGLSTTRRGVCGECKHARVCSKRVCLRVPDQLCTPPRGLADRHMPARARVRACVHGWARGAGRQASLHRGLQRAACGMRRRTFSLLRYTWKVGATCTQTRHATPRHDAPSAQVRHSQLAAYHGSCCHVPVGPPHRRFHEPGRACQQLLCCKGLGLRKGPCAACRVGFGCIPP